MVDNIRDTINESLFRSQVNESIDRMLDCILTRGSKTCKSCSDVSICSFVTEAVFAFRQKLMGSIESTTA